MTQTLDLSNRDIRQRDLVPPEKLAACHALVIGVGAVGRQVAWQLAAMGITRMTLVDHDQVSVENLAPQGYLPTDLTLPKVVATAESCWQLNPDLQIEVHRDRFRRSSTQTLSCFLQQKKLAIFCCVDSIEVRGLIFHSVKSHAAFFVDTRMAAEVIRVLASDHPPTDGHYPSTLFQSEQAYIGSCTAKSTIYTASIAAGLMLGQFTRWLRGLPVDPDILLNVLASEMTAT